MKFKTPSKSSAISATATVAGAIVGGAASRGAFGAMHKADDAIDAASVKKQRNAALLKHGAIAVAGILLSSCVTSDDAMSKAVKGAGIGMAVTQGLEIVKELSKDNAELQNPSSKAKKFIADSVGLGCGCGQSGLNAARKRRVPRLRAANLEITPIGQSIELPALAMSTPMSAPQIGAI